MKVKFVDGKIVGAYLFLAFLISHTYLGTTGTIQPGWPRGAGCREKLRAFSASVIKRLINLFRDFGIAVGGVLVNMVIQNDHVRPDSPEFVKNRVAMQDSCMQEMAGLR